ncbi:hypothetical protein [Rhizobium paknamense]|uniref:Uncharacterized protein n=1 Tax=Rhizobium paknamense TaxID=1206817 RepID=A0ABU0IEY0_9HYPH|nr:hypothetical protein [Rhizobium paknamense]MDQ0456793.1 hypothetical protein [Rhizobium paknamense]
MNTTYEAISVTLPQATDLLTGTAVGGATGLLLMVFWSSAFGSD